MELKEHCSTWFTAYTKTVAIMSSKQWIRKPAFLNKRTNQGYMVIMHQIIGKPVGWEKIGRGRNLIKVRC